MTLILSYNKSMATNSDKASGTFSDFEREAMKNRAKELKAEEKLLKSREDGEKILQAAIAEMSDPDKSMAKKIHEVVSTVAPELMPKTWYGMPAYANKEGKVVVFFQAAKKFQSRYATLGFNDSANLDEGNMWPTAYALKEISDTEAKKISELVKKAVS